MSNIISFKTPIVHTEGNRVFASSRDVAAYFEKRHDVVMRAIRDVLDADPTLSRNFAEIEIDTLVGYGWRKFPAYEMDRKGFTMLAFGFTGEKAITNARPAGLAGYTIQCFPRMGEHVDSAPTN